MLFDSDLADSMAMNDTSEESLLANSTTFTPPIPNANDYIKIGLLSFILAFGAPLNAFVLWQQCSEYRKALRSRKRDSSVSYLLQKIHLNLANLLLIITHCSGFIAWYTTYSWKGGDFMCRFCHMLWNTTLYASSFLVAVIAIDRLKSLTRIDRARHGGAIAQLLANGKTVMRPIKTLIFLAWTMSILISLPQLAVFQVITLSPEYSQCSTMWAVERYYQPSSNKSESTVISMEKLYILFHITTIFWLPLGVILICYCLIMFKELRYSKEIQRKRSSAQNGTIFKSPPSIEFPTPDSDHNLSSNSTNPRGSVTDFYSPFQNGSTTFHDGSTSQNQEDCNTSKTESFVAISKKMSISTPNLQRSLLQNDMAELEELGKKRSSRGTIQVLEAFREKAQSFNLRADLIEMRKKRSKRIIRLSKAQKKARALSLKLLRSSLLIVSAYIILWLPYNSLSLIALINSIDFGWANENLDWLTSVILFNAIVNPFFYSYGNIKRFMKRLKGRRRAGIV